MTMKTLLKWALLPALLLLAACAVSTARQQALLPAMQTAWPPIRAIVAAELLHAPDAATADAVTAADAAMHEGAPEAVAAVAWPLIDVAHEAGVQRRLAAREIGPGVAKSLRKRLQQFADGRVAFTKTRTP